MIITIDGPGAAGKSTVAKEVARRLRFRYLDTGAMYRAITWKALQAGVDMADAGRLAVVARETDIELEPANDGTRVLCDGSDITGEIRTPAVTENIFLVADEPAVRQILVEMQREFGRRYNLVAEGRDQGTVVFPDAEAKFFLDASLDERARRRAADLRESGAAVRLPDVLELLANRDDKDRARPVGALRRPEGTILIDSTNMSVDLVVRAILDELERRRLLPDHC